jgi:predicted small secreted protein
MNKTLLIILVLAGSVMMSGCMTAGGIAQDIHAATGLLVDLTDPLSEKAEMKYMSMEQTRLNRFFERHQAVMAQR